MAKSRSGSRSSGGRKKSSGGRSRGRKSSSRSGSRRYGKKASKKVEQTMRERKRGTLRSGSGKKVKSRKQAIAIGLSKARKEGAKVPEPDSSSS